MKFVLIFFILSNSLDTAFSQLLDWHKASGWMMYDTAGRGKAFKWDSVSTYPSTRLSEDTMSYYLSNVSQILSVGPGGAAWMGYYRVTCRLSDTTRPILVSNYGGFFEDLFTGKYYEIPIPDRASWLDYLTQKFGSIVRPVRVE